MTAALVVDQHDPWPVAADKAEARELYRACSDLWAGALGRYFEDARQAMRGVRAGDGGEALDDLTGSRELLANLLAGFGGAMDADRLADAMIQALDAGRRFHLNGMNRAVKEIPEDYSGCTLAGKAV